MPGRQKLPKPILCATAPGRAWYARRAQRAFADPRRFDPGFARVLDATILPDLWSIVDFDGDGVPDAVSFAFTNAGVTQRLVGVRAAFDGRRHDAGQVRVDNGTLVCRASAITRIQFHPGEPLIITLLGIAAKPGVHFLDLRLRGEIEDILFTGLPVLIDRDGVRPAWHVESESVDPTLRTAPIALMPYAHFDLAGELGFTDATQVAVGILQEALRLVDERPEFTFAFAHAAPIAELAARRPDDLDELRALVKDGRFEPLCAGMSSTAPLALHGEFLVRHVVRWQRFARGTFGRESRTGWWTHAGALGPQTPQILLKSGINALVVSETSVPPKTPPHFWWRGLDGARIATLNLGGDPIGAHGVAAEPERAMRRWFDVVARLAGRFDRSTVALPSGGLLAAPRVETALAREEWNRRFPASPMRFATPGAVLAEIDRSKLTTLGPMRPASRSLRRESLPASPPLHAASHAAADALCDLETLHAMTRPTGDADARLRRGIERLWDDALAATSAAAISGAVGAKAHDETARRLGRVHRESEDLARDLLGGALAGSVRAKTRIAVANTLGFARQETVEVWLEALGGVLPVVHDTRRALPSQVLERELYADGTVKRARTALLVHVPACAIRVYDLTYGEAPLDAPPRRYFAKATDEAIENGFVRAELDPRRATLRSMWDRKHDANFGFDHAGRIVWTPGVGPPRPWRRGREFQVDEINVLENGPVRAAVRFGGAVAGRRMSVTYRITQGTRHIEAIFEGLANLAGGRTRIEFPTEFRRGAFRVETPFGRASSGAQRALGFAALARGSRELVFLGDGSPNWAHRRGCVTLGVDAPFEGGRDSLRYGLLAHVGPATRDHASRRAQAFVRPLRVVGPSSVPEGAGSASLVRVDPPNVTMTALRRAGGDVEMRVFESAGEGGTMRLVFASPPRSVTVTDLLGRPAKSYAVDGRAVSLPIGPFEIKTLRFESD
ncbi:MAG: hypothetical protein IT350_11630 [Deltaproteobacteria bacterium]|nr:hypothetical protein [Deltaproteobacteria bacterium]